MNENIHNEIFDDIPEPFKNFTEDKKQLYEKCECSKSKYCNNNCESLKQNQNSMIIDLICMYMIFDIFSNKNKI